MSGAEPSCYLPRWWSETSWAAAAPASRARKTVSTRVIAIVLTMAVLPLGLPGQAEANSGFAITPPGMADSPAQ